MKGHKGIRAGWAAGNQHLYMVNHVRAKEMRQNPTEAEKVVWEIVRANRLGYKFRRQQTIGEYIVDFFCLLPHPKPLSSSEGMCKGLVIEVDGGYHIILPKNQTTLQKRKKVVPLPAKSSRLWEDTVNLMPPLRQKWQSPHSSKRVLKLVSD